MSKLHFRYSSMNAGKTSALLQVAFNYNEIGKKTLLLTAAVDDRAGVGVIASRIGISAPAETYTDTTDFFELIKARQAIDPVVCVLIDEAQFMTGEQARQLHRAAHVLHVPVICFGIRSDFRGLPFEGSAMLLSLAEEIEKLRSSCLCGKHAASMNMRVDENGKRVKDGAQVDIGGNARYRPVCGECFYAE